MQRFKTKKVVGAIVSLLVALELIGENTGVGLTDLFDAVSTLSW